MASTFAWLDHSESKRRQMLDIIALFKEQGTLDELGLGSVRDAFADLLFPGTSTIQTRARYFLFVPWVYRYYEERRTSSADIERLARGRELALINALREGGDLEGLIGRDAGNRLQRLPSSVYWNGLRVWGIRLFDGSRDQYHRSLDTYYRRLAEAARAEREGLERVPANWHPGLPTAPEGLFERTTFALRDDEADYLRERILIRVPDTMLAELVARGRPSDVALPWQQPDLGVLSSEVRETLAHARNFSEVIWGAQALYNLLLARKAERDDLTERYEALMDEWVGLVEARLDELRAWERPAFWTLVLLGNAQVPPRTRRFIDDWLNRALDAPDAVRADDGVHEAIVHRERSLKGRRARLSNRDALERWGGESGLAQHDYRWSTVQVIVNDILEGLERARA